MSLSATQLEQQKRQAEELLFSGPETMGFVKGLFFGHFNAGELFPYPQLSPAAQAKADQSVTEVRQFCREKIDAAAIDRLADIPRSVIDGLGALGVLGMAAHEDIGGRGFSQQAYCQVIEVLGGHCASTTVFVNAHHSIGLRALLLFGTPEQQKRWLPDLINGRKMAAFALTEPLAGSDAANVQTMATPTEDGTGYILNGEKRYITNGGIADVLTVMARTPAPSSGKPNDTRVTAFLVTPDMPGFEVVETRAEKCGIRGTATGKLRFTNMRVPKENILGPVGKGLKVALTVLDFGRTTFGASCTGAAKACLQAAVKHAKSRVQFQQPLADFEMVKKKIAFIAAHAFAMESATTQCAALIDRGAEDYMLETAILKVFATEHLWTCVYETMQIFGGQSYFTNEPYERWMRDARINTIGEGANEVLKAFIAVVGSRGPGLKLDGLRRGMKSKPFGTIPKLFDFGWQEMGRRMSRPDVPVKHALLKPNARRLAKRVKKLGTLLPWVFLKCGTEERFLQAQLLHERIADIVMDLYVSSCVLSRLDMMLARGRDLDGHPEHRAQIDAGMCYLKMADRRMAERFTGLFDNDDDSTISAANSALG
ncbi:acyl-CoA dehydrogenase family protein [Zavarzinella formosa]|uniref:acyl-CoA dehydrogenase family protein n=1 Tax=Zavarzinella formosa TaxID=360055 RepID=UPI0002E32328|nr:acyl-CoA dehydrogenase family protein [Zavarzinella formosa]